MTFSATEKSELFAVAAQVKAKVETTNAAVYAALVTGTEKEKYAAKQNRKYAERRWEEVCNELQAASLCEEFTAYLSR